MSMETGTGKLTVNARTETGKGAARRLRAAGNVPGVVYGATVDGTIQPLPVVVNVKALQASLDPVRKQNTVIELTIAGGAKPTTLSALLKDYQLDLVRREVTHVDLLAIDPNKEVVAEVPLEFSGKHAGLLDGGLLHIVLRSVQVRTKPASIPTKLVVDVSPLNIGDVLHVSDIPLAAGVAWVTGTAQAVITCNAPEKDAPAEAAAAAPAEGAAPAAGAAAAPAAAGKDGKAAAPAGKDAKAAAPAPAKKK